MSGALSESFADAFFATPEVAAALCDDAALRQMCVYESALARAEGDVGAIPPQAAASIAAALKEFELPAGAARDKLFTDAAKAGTLAIPFVKLLTAAVRARDPEAARYVHYGATSQDVIDSALVLQLAEALVTIEADLARLCAAAADLAKAHRDTLILGRTLLQPAIPIAFSLKAAQWLVAGIEARGFIAGAKAAALVPQCGGAAGTLGSLGDKGIEVARRIGAYLPGLHAPKTHLPWQTRRGALVALCGAIGIAAGVCGKIARDVSLMMQFEVAEAFEAIEEGRGGSSALPHKRNPVRSMQILACAAQIGPLVGQMLAGLPQEHERALGGWQAEWPVVPQIFKLASGALANAACLLEGLNVDAARMRANLDALKGLPFAEAFSIALAPKLGRDEAYRLVESASRQVPDSGQTLALLLAADPQVARHISAQELAEIGDPHRALGATGAFIDEALGLWDDALLKMREGGLRDS